MYMYCIYTCISETFWTDLEWKVTYVGSAESEEYDQVLDTVLVGPLPAGTHKFVLQVSHCVTFKQSVK